MEVTNTQVKKYEENYKVVLNNRQKRMAVNRVFEQVAPIHSDNKQPLIWYVTGTGEYSKAYLTKNYNLKPLLDLYKKEERKIKREVEEAIQDERRKRYYAEQEKEKQYFKDLAKDFLENNNIKALENAIGVAGIPKDPVEALAEVLRDYRHYQNEFYKDYR